MYAFGNVCCVLRVIFFMPMFSQIHGMGRSCALCWNCFQSSGRLVSWSGSFRWTCRSCGTNNWPRRSFVWYSLWRAA